MFYNMSSSTLPPRRLKKSRRSIHRSAGSSVLPVGTFPPTPEFSRFIVIYGGTTMSGTFEVKA